MTDKDGRTGSGMLAGYLAGFCEELSRCGYGPVRLGAHLELFTDLCQWAEREGIAPAGLDSGQIAAFLADRRRRGRTDLILASGVRPLTAYLAGAGAIPVQEFVIAEGPAREVLERYRRYLKNERGLAGGTIERYAGITARFAAGLERGREICWQEVRAREVTRFLVRSCPQRRSGHAPEAVPALRSFLRFCCLDGVIPSALDGAVPAAAGKRRDPLPKGIPADDLDLLLASCDRERPRGRRDYAILVLLARLRLRAGEVAVLTLDDIDWRRGELACAENFILAGEEHDASRPRFGVSSPGTARERPRRGGRRGMMRDCAVATGLFDGVGHVRGLASSLRERGGRRTPRSWSCAIRSRCWSASWAGRRCASPLRTGFCWPRCCTG